MRLFYILWREEKCVPKKKQKEIHENLFKIDILTEYRQIQSNT